MHGAVGDALHALSCAAGYNIRWLMRAIARLGLRGLFCALSAVVAYALLMLQAMLLGQRAHGSPVKQRRAALPPSASWPLAVVG